MGNAVVIPSRNGGHSLQEGGSFPLRGLRTTALPMDVMILILIGGLTNRE